MQNEETFALDWAYMRAQIGLAFLSWLRCMRLAALLLFVWLAFFALTGLPDPLGHP